MPTFSRKRVVVVTGASRGLGRQIALTFGKSGDRVVVNYLHGEQEARSVVDDIIRAGGEAVAVRANVRNAGEVDALIHESAEQWGGIDVVVNNAGITKDGPMLRISEETWDNVLDTNLKGAFHTIRSVAPIMIKKQDGHIVNISSIVGVQGREGQAPYASSKAGLIGLSKSAAKELGRFNIKVNTVLPGYLFTDMGRGVSEAIAARVMRENTLGRASDPVEAAEFIFRLTLMSNVSGQVFNLDSRVL
jgi:3-oxoacyl-[acyl-carrier protein] reductase